MNQSARKPRSRVVVWLVSAAAALVALPLGLALVGSAYHAVAGAVDQRNYPAPGQLLDVGGYRLHIYCTGQGSPTVVLDSANQGTVSNWIWVQSELALTTRTCSYDRAGLGWSDLSPEPQDARQNARALHALLREAGAEGPYVLVGHSLGALYTRMFAEEYPDEAAGLVFVEGTHPNAFQALGLSDVMPNAPDAAMMDATPWISRLGILRVMGFPASDPDLPARQSKELQAYLASTKWAHMIKQQYQLFPRLLAEVRPLYGRGSLGDRPVAVVLGGRGDGGVEALREPFRQQAALSSDSVVRRIEDATHISLVDKSEHAKRTCEVIRQVLDAARSGGA